MKVVKATHIWSSNALLLKAKRYADNMCDQDRQDWQFGFWSVLTLEMLGRAALARISPTLVADGKDWNNVYFALGHSPRIAKYSPKSADSVDVFSRLESVFPEFNKDLLNFCITHIARRNSELHSGDLPFDGLGSSVWLADYYLACKALLQTLDKDLAYLFGDDESDVAEELINASRDEAAKAVRKTIAAHQTVWEEKADADKKKATKEADSLATRHNGHRVACPACRCVALVYGNPMGVPTTTLDDLDIIVRQSLKPSSFECFACELKITGYSKLVACGLGDSFTSTERYTAAEYFGVETEEVMREPDFNEY